MFLYGLELCCVYVFGIGWLFVVYLCYLSHYMNPVIGVVCCYLAAGFGLATWIYLGFS